MSSSINLKNIAITAGISLFAQHGTNYDDPVDCELTSESCGVYPFDSCCVPDKGVIVLAHQWIPKKQKIFWTVHGLWPNNCDHSLAPKEGCGGADIDIDLALQRDSGLKNNMDIFWPDSNSNNTKFWNYEWVKHGTCLSTVHEQCLSSYEEGDEALAYFRVTLDLYSKFNVYKILADSGVFPGYYFKKHEILDPLQKHHKVNLICNGDVLKEVQVFYIGQSNHQFRQIDTKQISKCPEYIIYPDEITFPDKPSKKNSKTKKLMDKNCQKKGPKTDPSCSDKLFYRD